MPTLPYALPEANHGLVTTDQLQAASLSVEQIRHLVVRGQLVRLSPRLLRVAGTPETPAQRLLAAVLDTGPKAAISHTTALAWWGVPGFPLDEIHVTRPRDAPFRRRRFPAHVHDVVLLPPHHVRVLDAVPVVAPARALFDIAGQQGVSPGRVERAVDNAWSRRLVSGATLHAMLEELGGRGRPGIRVMREVLESRGADYVPPASGLEGRVVQILRDAGARPLRRQVDCGDQGWSGRVDFADDKVPFVLEVQSERFHTSLVDQRSDAERFQRLHVAGFVVATVTDTDVWHRPAWVLQVVRDGRRRAAHPNLP